MVIIYESKTGFTKRYAEMLAAATGMKCYPTNQRSKVDPTEDVLFLGWMRIGKIQGLKKVRKMNLKAVCGSGSGKTAEPDVETIRTRNKLDTLPFFYYQGGCHPLKELKWFDRIMMSMFVKTLKSRNDKDVKRLQSIAVIENGFDGVKKENLEPLLEWLDLNYRRNFLPMIFSAGSLAALPHKKTTR